MLSRTKSEFIGDLNKPGLWDFSGHWSYVCFFKLSNKLWIKKYAVCVRGCPRKTSTGLLEGLFNFRVQEAEML